MDNNILLIIVLIVILLFFMNRTEFYENFNPEPVAMWNNSNFVGLNWDLRNPDIVKEKYEYKSNPNYRMASDIDLNMGEEMPLYSRYGFPINCQSKLSTNSLTRLGGISGYYD